MSDHSVLLPKRFTHGGSLWQKDRMVTHILFYLCLFKHFSPVANFGYQSLTIIIIKKLENLSILIRKNKKEPIANIQRVSTFYFRSK